MHRRLTLAALSLVATLVLAACVIAPGKFTSHLTLRQDGSFIFTYVGEVHAQDVEQLSNLKTRSEAPRDPAEAAAEHARKEAEKRQMAASLAKEAGYNRVEYRGNDTWFIDYRAAGKLTHTFLFPYSLDSEVVFPFIALEPRANGTVRIKAPAFAASKSAGDMGGVGGVGGPDRGNDRLDGTFTLDTDAEIVSQNNENGATPVGTMRRIVWRATPQLKDAPMATVRLSPGP